MRTDKRLLGRKKIRERERRDSEREIEEIVRERARHGPWTSVKGGVEARMFLHHLFPEH